MLVHLRMKYALFSILSASLLQLCCLLPALAQSTANPPKADSLPRLIGQLGSKSFSERQKANDALRKIGTKALPPLRVAAREGKDLELRRRAAVLVGQIENSLEGLLEFYSELGLPLPPAGAQLVCFDHPPGLGPDGKPLQLQTICFVLSSPDKGKRPVLLVGTEEYAPSVEMEKYLGKLKLIDIDPDEDLPKRIMPQWQRLGFATNAGLATALQCKAEGYDGFAQALWDRCAKAGAGYDGCTFNHPANLSPRKDIAYLAWTYFGNELVKPKSDRVAIAKKIKSLMKAEASIATKENREILRSLELALVPSISKAGSVEKLIDDLADLSGPWTNPGDPDADPRYRKLAEVGFSAVPTLIEHLDDPRITRVMYLGFHHSPARICKVGEFVESVLHGIAGFDVIGEWRSCRKDPAGAKADASRWFAKAQEFGEEAYYVKHLFPADPNDERFNSCMLNLIAIKYPKQLPVIYRKMVDTKSKVSSQEVVEAIIDSAMPNTEKVALFTYATRNARMVDREAAHWALKQLEKKAQSPGK